jgi:hypothetical protein
MRSHLLNKLILLYLKRITNVLISICWLEGHLSPLLTQKRDQYPCQKMVSIYSYSTYNHIPQDKYDGGWYWQLHTNIKSYIVLFSVYDFYYFLIIFNVPQSKCTLKMRACPSIQTLCISTILWHYFPHTVYIFNSQVKKHCYRTMII